GFPLSYLEFTYLSLAHLGVSAQMPLKLQQDKQQRVFFMEDSKWVEIYHKAVIETNPAIMPEKIQAARQAIDLKLLEPVANGERTKLEHALECLDQLEYDAQNWPA